MELNTLWNFVCVRREFHSSSLLVPGGAPEDYMSKIFRFFLAPDAELANVESAVSTDFMPHSTKRSIESTSKAVLSFVGTSLQVTKALCAEAGF
eukprot:4462952-Amphidinium_carterae.1